MKLRQVLAALPILLAFCPLAIQSAKASTPAHHVPQRRGSDNQGAGTGGASNPFGSTGNFYCDQFQTLLSRNTSATMDGFLSTVANQFDLNQSITTKTAFYNSRAKHGTTFENPRALIMYGNSDLILAFNGSRDEAFYDSLETMCYNKLQAKFEFRKIQFKAESTPADLAPNPDVQFENSVVRVSRANPTACAECHGTTVVRPSWGTYLAWRGAYGSYEESFALDKIRWATEDRKLELTNLLNFQSSSSGKERYKHFMWGNNNAQTGLAMSTTLFGIMVNYQMSNAAIRSALAALAQPQNDKFKYAFAGYLLGCNESFVPKGAPSSRGLSDSADDLRPLMTSMLSSRFKFEVGERMSIEHDLNERGETMNWVRFSLPGTPMSLHLDSSIVPHSLTRENPAPISLSAAITTRPDSIYKFARMENLYSLMNISPEMLHLRDSKSSWDGYNEIQDYMADYLLKFYGLPAITPIQKRQAEKFGPRNDLDTHLLEEDYASAKNQIGALQLPPISAGGQPQLCVDLARASQSSLAH
jgi:hypothetical protein